MANYHLTVKALSRTGGKSCVAALAYRSGTCLVDQREQKTWDYTDRHTVGHVDILVPENAPSWVSKLAEECQTDKQSALQKFSDICEAHENRKDSRVYREVEFSLPNELTDEQNIAWAKEFVTQVLVKKGMVTVVNFHFDVDPDTGGYKPHCHALLTTRHLTKDGFALKNRDWNSKELVEEAREQCAQYQNAALKEHGFAARVTHLSYVDREIDIEGQTKLSRSIREMTKRGIATDRQQTFDMVRLKNQFKILKNPEMVFTIVTSNHSTFTRHDVARVLNRYIDDATQFQKLLDRLMGSKELVELAAKTDSEPVYTTKHMLETEVNLIKTAEGLQKRQTHAVAPQIIEKVIAKQNKKLAPYGGLSTDQEAAIRHLLGPSQISCVVGFAGSGKSTCLEAVNQAWDAAGYKVVGLAPTGKAVEKLNARGIRSMTVHKFLYAQKNGRERISDNTVLVLDEVGMVGSKRLDALVSLVAHEGAKISTIGDGKQLQAMDAGPGLRLMLNAVTPVTLETIVRQQIGWQRDATRLFGMGQPRQALELYKEHITLIQEPLPDFTDKNKLVDNYCLSRQISGRIWQEMMQDFKQAFADAAFDPETDIAILAVHQDYSLFKEWQQRRRLMVASIIDHYDSQASRLQKLGVDVQYLQGLVNEYKANPESHSFAKIEEVLQQMSYTNMADTRPATRKAMVAKWAQGYETMPDKTHIMLCSTTIDAVKLNGLARQYMREQGVIKGTDRMFMTKSINYDDFGKEVLSHAKRAFAIGDQLLFTRNNNGIGVNNGSLGIITAITPHKITVRFLLRPPLRQGFEQQEGFGGQVGRQVDQSITFSPNLYPFIDNGWATTIRKAQGVDAKIATYLPSFDQHSNLAYVGMTRHSEQLNIFASHLDFWRPEKIIDRLSRPQEKLSGIDYLSPKQIAAALRDADASDTSILGFKENIAALKDLWTAVKITAKEAWEEFQGKERTPNDMSSSGLTRGQMPGFRSFEDSEEERSREMFKPEPGAGAGAENHNLFTVDWLPSTDNGLAKLNHLRKVLTDPAMLRLKNAHAILKDPEIVFDVITKKQSTFTSQDITRILGSVIDDKEKVELLHTLLMLSSKLITLRAAPEGELTGDTNETIYTTKDMQETELQLVRLAKDLQAQQTHPVSLPKLVERREVDKQVDHPLR